MDQFNGLVLVKDSNEQGVECNPLRRINGAKRRAKMNIIYIRKWWVKALGKVRYKDMEQFNCLLLVKDSNGQGVECNPLRRINGAKRRASLLLVKDSNG